MENTLRLTGYGTDDGGGQTHLLLTSISNGYGNIASFTGTYRANTWRLTIHRQNPDPSEYDDV